MDDYAANAVQRFKDEFQDKGSPVLLLLTLHLKKVVPKVTRLAGSPPVLLVTMLLYCFEAALHARIFQWLCNDCAELSQNGQPRTTLN